MKIEFIKANERGITFFNVLRLVFLPPRGEGGGHVKTHVETRVELERGI